jgi:phage terminase Nu1 subunit (DNA packaging protein)
MVFKSTTKPSQNKGMLVNKIRCCEIFGWTRQIFDKHVREGMPCETRPETRGQDYQVYTANVMRWLLNQAVTAATGEDDIDDLDSDLELAKLRRQQTEAVAIKNATARGELLPKEEVVEEQQARIGRARALLLSLPGALADDLAIIEDPKVVRQRLHGYMNRALQELSRSQDEVDQLEEEVT